MPYFTDLGGPTPKLVRDFMSEPTKESQHSEKKNLGIMNDYISRGAAIKALSHGEGCGHVCRHSIERIPAADVVEVKLGKWISEPNCWYRCSCCGDHYPSVKGYMSYNYCPRCGAKMEILWGEDGWREG